jgi:hypothetical protein
MDTDDYHNPISLYLHKVKEFEFEVKQWDNKYGKDYYTIRLNVIDKNNVRIAELDFFTESLNALNVLGKLNPNLITIKQAKTTY